MADQLSLLPASAGRPETWFRAVDLLCRRFADVSVHDCEGGWREAEAWCYLAVLQINRAIRFAWEIEQQASTAAGLRSRRNPPAPCCADGPFDRHYLAHVVANLRRSEPRAPNIRQPP